MTARLADHDHEQDELDSQQGTDDSFPTVAALRSFYVDDPLGLRQSGTGGTLFLALMHCFRNARAGTGCRNYDSNQAAIID